MTEYWVSQSKYYCKVCNCYMADNKISRQHHDSSVRHKTNLDKIAKKRKEDELHGAKNEKELRDTLSSIERAAHAAMGMNHVGRGDSARSQMPKIEKSYTTFESTSFTKAEEENNGIYKIRGKTYLDGKVFEHKLVAGAKCEIFVEELDDWFGGEIKSVKETPIPNTSVALRRFEVTYVINADSPEDAEVLLESNVSNDRLRIIAGEESEEEIASNGIDAAIKAFQKNGEPIKNEVTGLGVWQTVSVKTIDEEREAEEHHKAIEQAYNLSVGLEDSSSGAASSHLVTEPVLKTYKGISIEDIHETITYNHFEDSNLPTTFRKRKLDEVQVKSEGDEPAQQASFGARPMKVKNYRKK